MTTGLRVAEGLRLVAPVARRGTARCTGAALIAACVLAGVPGASAQERVVAASLEADLSDGVSASVRLEVEIEGALAGAPLPTSVLDFGDAAVADVLLGAAAVPIRLTRGVGVARGATVTAEPTGGDRTRVIVAYRVPGAVERRDGRIRARVPVLSVDRPPADARPGLFTATLRLPLEWLVTDAFPTGMVHDDGAGVSRVELSVVPALLTVRARSDGRPGLTLPLFLDSLAIVLLAVVALVGWRHMREVAA